MSIFDERGGPPARLCHFQRGKSFSEGCSFIGSDLTDEMHERCGAATGGRRLSERIHHEAGNEFVSAVKGDVAVSSIVALLNDELLLGQPLQNGHHRCVGEFAVSGQRFVDLSNCLWFRGLPQMIHHCTLEFA